MSVEVPNDKKRTRRSVRAKLVRDHVRIEDWRVEKLCADGASVELAIFSGSTAKERAIRYAEREYGTVREIESNNNPLGGG